MKYTPSVMVGSMSGTSGGTVASSWKGILYVRRHVIPHNPKSDAQVIQRDLMARMAPWFRSLPSEIVAKLNDLGSPCRLSGFNVMTKQSLTEMAAAATPSLVPGNPDCNSLFSAADDGSILDAELEVIWIPGEAVAGNYVVALSCPVDPDEVGLTEPDAWSLATTPVLVSEAGYSTIPVLNIAKDYWVVLLVIDTATLAAATVISGGVACLCTSGETP